MYPQAWAVTSRDRALVFRTLILLLWLLTTPAHAGVPGFGAHPAAGPIAPAPSPAEAQIAATAKPPASPLLEADRRPGHARNPQFAEDAAHPLPFFYDLYTFRDSDGSTAVVAAFAVEVGKLQPERSERGVRYRFDVSLVLADTALRSVSRTDDSVYVDLQQPLAGEHLLYTHIGVEAPPSRTTVHRVIMTDATRPGVGQLYSSAFAIPDYNGTELMLSDIALGQPDSEGGFTRGEVTLALLPTGLFPVSSFDVFYEVYNLPAGNPYTTEIFVEPVDDDGRPRDGEDPVRLRFDGEVPEHRRGVLQELRHVGASLERGRYRITVRVTDESSGAAVDRSRSFEVRGWSPGTTLVAALPRKGGLRARNR